MRAAALALVALTVLGTACGRDSPGDPPSGVSPPAPGFTRIVGTGFTIDMPAGWRQPALDPAAIDQTASALRPQNPRLAEALQKTQASSATDTRLFAIDPSDGSSVNLIVTTAGNRSLEAVVGDAESQLQQVGATSLRRDDANLGGRPAVRLAFDLPVRGESGVLAVPETQYYLVHEGRLFILTLFGTNPTLTAVAESLRVT